MGTVKSSLINPEQLQFVEVSREYTSGDGTGLVVVYKYRGSKDALRVASLAWVNAGGKYQIIENGAYSEATVTYSGTAVPIDYALQTGEATTPAPITQQTLNDETPSFRYEFRTEYIDASLFDLAKVRAEAKKFVETFGTGTVPEENIRQAVLKVFDLRPAAIIADLELLNTSVVKYRPTAAYGHFGRPGFTWERTDRAEALKAAI